MSALSGKLPFHKPGIRTGGAPKADLVITIVMLLLIIPLVVVGLRYGNAVFESAGLHTNTATGYMYDYGL
jgi:hypothetical protein